MRLPGDDNLAAADRGHLGAKQDWSPTPLGYRPALDGVRAIAITLVLFVHTGAFLAPAWQDMLFPSGFLGVDIFFVLSGFLITSLLLERREREHHAIGTFYLRRILRLLPAVIVLLAANLAYAAIESHGVRDALRSFPVVLSYTTNWVELHHIFGGGVSSNLTHLWSLAIEEQFYLVWPLMLFGAIRLGFSRRSLLWLVLVGALICAAWRAELWHSGQGWLRIYLRTDARADALLIGAALALLPYRRWAARLAPRARTLLGASALLAIAAAAEVLQPSSAVLYLGGFTLIALLAAVLITSVLEAPSGAYRLLAAAPVVLLGRLSYSLYLWHFGIFQAVADHTRSMPAPARVLLGWSLTLAAAAASYRFVELPALRLKRRLGGGASSETQADRPPGATVPVLSPVK